MKRTTTSKSGPSAARIPSSVTLDDERHENPSHGREDSEQHGHADALASARATAGRRAGASPTSSGPGRTRCRGARRVARTACSPRHLLGGERRPLGGLAGVRRDEPFVARAPSEELRMRPVVGRVPPRRRRPRPRAGSSPSGRPTRTVVPGLASRSARGSPAPQMDPRQTSRHRGSATAGCGSRSGQGDPLALTQEAGASLAHAGVELPRQTSDEGRPGATSRARHTRRHRGRRRG